MNDLELNDPNPGIFDTMLEAGIAKWREINRRHESRVEAACAELLALGYTVGQLELRVYMGPNRKTEVVFGDHVLRCIETKVTVEYGAGL